MSYTTFLFLKGKKKILTFFLVLFSICNLYAQYADPLKIPLELSANFGELRNNHFHSGIDLKTERVINKPVYSIADGYVSRIFVSPGGYGLALYVTHPETGHTSVYGHLNKFVPEIASYVKEKQYEEETYRINIFPEKEKFPVKKGQFIAYSGNTGSSGGPHVHFEIRDTETEQALDPLVYYKNRITDNIPPEIRGIAIYPVDGEGAVNNSSNPLRQNISKAKNGSYLAPSTNVNAWGRIGLGIKAYDRMSGTTNIYGVRTVRVFMDNEKIFESVIDRYSFDETRMLNTFTDFEDWRRNKSFYMKSFVEPGNALSFYKTVNNGYINIDREKNYAIHYELEDLYGNITNYNFTIKGQKQLIPQSKKGSLYMVWNEDNHFINENFSLVILKGNLYDNFMFTLKQTPSTEYFSNRYMVNDIPVPFHKEAEMKIKLHTDTLSNKSQYSIVAITGNKERWIGGNYSNGYMVTNIREAGEEYAVSADKKAPVITPVRKEKWEKLSKIELKVTDDKSGVYSCKEYIDGNFALFENDVKSPVYTYHFDTDRLKKGGNHQLVFVAKDACGNTSEYTTEFYY